MLQHTFKIKEGLVTFNVNLKNIDCSFCEKVKFCNLKKCIHIYKIYHEIYGIPINMLQFLWTNNNYLRVLNDEKMIVKDIDTECLICLEDAGYTDYNPYKAIHCLDCGIFTHRKCLERSDKGIVCLNCLNDWIPKWMKDVD